MIGRFQNLQEKLSNVLLEMNNMDLTNQHLNKLNEELAMKLKAKDIEINNIFKQVNDKYSMKLRDIHNRNEMSEYNLENPYDQKRSIKKCTKSHPYPIEKNNSTYTQYSNLVYSEEQSSYSGMHQQFGYGINPYGVSEKKTLNSLNANSLEGTFVSKRDDMTDKTVNQNNSFNDEFKSDNYNVNSVVFNKNKETNQIGGHNMTFGDGNQVFKYKMSEKKVIGIFIDE